MSLIDIAIVSVILSIVSLYAYVRYREEKHKKEKMLIPTLQNYKQKFIEEKQQFLEKSQNLKQQLDDLRQQLQDLKKNLSLYPWTQSQVDYLKTMKGSEFEYFLTQSFEMLGFTVIDPPIYKDHNIDVILKYQDDTKTEYFAVDFIDYTQIKKLDDKYIENLLKGKDKYSCHKVLIITNGQLLETQKKLLIDKDVNFFETDQIVSFMPSINFFFRYDELRSKYHACEILHKETFDEVIRREHWLNEVEEKLLQAMEKTKA
ncbi:restriction endonuclease [Sulfurihydrogenibium azorense]|uniref:restriction endonuclease n=1 Tax=Sulfurihydrogenibium azorense TaxID=309806 RepID=UPI00240A000B|nr:restriction endonuclease [Sulfurihydrogenibium azorense]MDM7272958.1 restriction endonuclease [Sulfurihydrogenibium azorense]